ncbi:MAG: response regulator [Candidatus Muiribacterium halophilum]|uniref:Response regulator n=1 Tax=Muiribacterium halophilum TaxID=2053465 RepID=A0A2N5ZGD6_MUIH1|nr:MAG: response regulator [Candidatus Muirbacterium halophilum]
MDLIKGNGQKILIVEDTEENIIFLTTFLNKADYNVLQARDGKEALDILGSEKDISLVLMDIQMPVMDGIAAIKELRKLEEKGQKDPMYVFALTAHAMAGDEERCLEAGFDGYIAKPFRIKDILKKIDDVIKKD